MTSKQAEDLSRESEREKLLNQALARLSEHFDSVQIVATWTCARQTGVLADGSGNFFARLASTEHWLEKAQAHRSQYIEKELEELEELEEAEEENDGKEPR